jgi:hypothetical protein
VLPVCKVGELLGIFEVLPPIVVHSGETGQKFRQLLLQSGVVGFLRHVATVKNQKLTLESFSYSQFINCVAFIKKYVVK